MRKFKFGDGTTSNHTIIHDFYLSNLKHKFTEFDHIHIDWQTPDIHDWNLLPDDLQTPFINNVRDCVVICGAIKLLDNIGCKATYTFPDDFFQEYKHPDIEPMMDFIKEHSDA
jgi:hypothetical protein